MKTVTRSCELLNDWELYKWWAIILAYLVGSALGSIYTNMIIELLRANQYISGLWYINTSSLSIKILLRKRERERQDHINSEMAENPTNNEP